jgi:hypothetical protein
MSQRLPFGKMKKQSIMKDCHALQDSQWLAVTERVLEYKLADMTASMINWYQDKL